MSVDGKIAPRDRSAARFSSSADLVHLQRQVAQVDGVLFGAGTLRAYGTCLSVRDRDLLAQRQHRGQIPQPIQIVCSASGQLDPQMIFFRQAVPRWLLTTPAGGGLWQGEQKFDRVLPLLTTADASCSGEISPKADKTTNWREIAIALKAAGLTSLALLGGGALVAAWAEADLIDDLHLTVCPRLLGGAQTPTPCDGAGLALSEAPHLRLVSCRVVADEVFLHYRRVPTGDRVDG